MVGKAKFENRHQKAAPSIELLQLNRLIADTPMPATAIEADFAVMPHLSNDLRTIIRRGGTTYTEALRVKVAAQLLQRLPSARESMHLVIGGKFALADLIPAVLSIADPVKISALHIATLGFSKKNIEMLCRLVDAAQIGSLNLLCSHYFKNTSKNIYDLARDELAKRKPKASFLSLRTHAKLLAIKLRDGRTIVVESSANLRSNKNIEQLSIFGDPELYRFHTGWIVALFAKANHRKESHG